MGRLTLRRRLTLLVALAIVVPITVVGVMVVNLIGNQGEARAFDRARITSAFAVTSIAAEQQRLADRAAIVANDAAVRDAMAEGAEAIEGALRGVAESVDVDAIAITTTGGELVGGVRRQAQFASDVEMPPLEELTGTSAVALSASAEGDVGVVHASRWLDARYLATLARSENVAYTVVSSDRELIASTLGASTSLPARSLDERSEFTASLGGATRVVVATPIEGVPVTLLTSAPPDATANRTSLVAILGGLLLALLVLVVLVGHVVSGLVTGPVDDLVEAANAVSRGDLTKRVDLKGDQELVALGDAFNSMTDNLREYVSQLQQSRAEFQAAISRLGDVLVATHDIGGILDVVLEAATLTLKADLAVFFERVAMPARIRASAVWGGDGGPLPEIELNGVGVAGTAAKELVAVTFPGTGWLDLAEPVVSSAIAVPVMSDNRLFGVLAVYGRAGESLFSAEDVDTLLTLARQAEVAIGNVMLHDETRRQARTDGLTGLWNRREFELRAREAVKEAERFGEPFGVVIVDIDNFKLVNDRYDHTTGDAALIWIAARLSEATREIDVVARWGGEEFIVLLPRAGLDETAAVAERVRAAVAREPMIDGPKSLPLTVSIGYAVRPHDGTSADELFKAADTALLRAKRTGKNRVEHAGNDEGVA
ncbi:MAG TPA: diguanylate cyclase [Acidimicrobiales bacterium]|nr:diguanylate cyclase [Acidimicrobiales bacterium]